MDFGRPTNSGITMCGKTTTSRNGNNGSWVCSVNVGVVIASLILELVSDVGTKCGNTSPFSKNSHRKISANPPMKKATHEVALGWLYDGSLSDSC
jgi:hypothetical protein